MHKTLNTFISIMMILILFSSCTLGEMDDTLNSDHNDAILNIALKSSNLEMIVSASGANVMEKDSINTSVCGPVGTVVDITVTSSIAADHMYAQTFASNVKIDSVLESIKFERVENRMNTWHLQYTLSDTESFMMISPALDRKIVISENSNIDGTLFSDCDQDFHADITSGVKVEATVPTIDNVHIMLDERYTDDPSSNINEIVITADNVDYFYNINRNHISLFFPKTPEITVRYQEMKKVRIEVPEYFGVSLITQNKEYSLRNHGVYDFHIPHGYPIFIVLHDNVGITKSVEWKNINSVPTSTPGKSKILWSDIVNYDSKDIISPEIEYNSTFVMIREPSVGKYATYESESAPIDVMNDGTWTRYHFELNVPVTFKAVERNGYIFSGWGNLWGDKDTLSITTGSTLYTKITPEYASNIVQDKILYVEGMDYTVPPLTGSGSIPLGSESNPLSSLEEAVKLAKDGYEIRLFEGDHFIHSPLFIDSDIKITGGWRLGSGRTKFRYSDDAKGSPTNLATFIIYDEAEPCADSIIIREGADVSIDGLVIKTSQRVVKDLGGSIIKVNGTAALDLSNSTLIAGESRQSFRPVESYGIFTLGELHVKNSTFRIQNTNVNAFGIKAYMDTPYPIDIRSCDFFIGGANDSSATGLYIPSESVATIFNNNIHVSGTNKVEGLSVKKARVAENTIAVRLLSGEVSASCITSDYIPELIATNNRLSLIIDDGYGRGPYYALDLRSGKSVITNNVIFADGTNVDLGGARISNGVYEPMSTSVCLIGNYIRCGNSKDGSFSPSLGIDAINSKVLLLNNTIVAHANTADTEGSASSVIRMDNSVFYAINNIFYGARSNDTLLSPSGILLLNDSRCLRFESNVFFDLYGDLVYKNEDTRAKTIEEIASVLGSTEKNSDGENIGEERLGFSGDIYYLNKDAKPSLTENASHIIRSSGMQIDNTVLDQIYDTVKTDLPNIEGFLLRDAIQTDMNGLYRRKDSWSIGAVQY